MTKTERALLILIANTLLEALIRKGDKSSTLQDLIAKVDMEASDPIRNILEK